MAVDSLSASPAGPAEVAGNLAQRLLRYFKAQVEDWCDACRQLTTWEDRNLVDQPTPDRLAEHAKLLDELEQALKECRNGVTSSLTNLASALEAFSKAEFQHMATEESIILPTARKHLTKEDWAMIAAAFSENKTPSAECVTEELFKGTFASIMHQASPATRLAPLLA